jgi:hypothetical protein
MYVIAYCCCALGSSAVGVAGGIQGIRKELSEPLLQPSTYTGGGPVLAPYSADYYLLQRIPYWSLEYQ